MTRADRRSILAFIIMTALALTVGSLLPREDAAVPAAGGAVVPVSAGNWGLSFPAEGEAPVGNATPEALRQYDAYYIGDSSQKVLYLTFDCGYENGYTEQILDTLKKHNAPAALTRKTRFWSLEAVSAMFGGLLSWKSAKSATSNRRGRK